MTRPRTSIRVLLIWTTAVACYCAVASVLTLSIYGWLAGAVALGLAVLGLSLLNERTQQDRSFVAIYILTAMEWAFHTSLFADAKSPNPPPSGNFLAGLAALAEALDRVFDYASLMALLLAISAVLLWRNWNTLPHRVAILVFQLPAAIAAGWFAVVLIWELVEG